MGMLEDQERRATKSQRQRNQRRTGLPKWQLPALLISVTSLQTAFAFQDAETVAPTQDEQQTAAKSRLESLLDDAEQLLGKARSARQDNIDLLRKENAELLESARKLTDSEARTTSLSELTQMLSGQQEFTTAREAALEIDQTQLVEKVRALNTVARAEAASDNTENAWLTLHESQQLALQLKNPEQLIGLLREIGTVERELREKAAKVTPPTSADRPASNDAEEETRLDPKPEKVIQKVLYTGIPPAGYQEIELVREGGGPLREARAIAHSYYYNGDRIFQGPMFPGGPTDVHAIHPRTGEGCIFRVNMPTGTPFIEYSEHSIEYYFPDIVVELNFRRNGGYEVDYRTLFNKYDKERKKFLSRRTHALQGLNAGGTGSTAGQLLRIGLGAPVNIVRRLPIVSDLLDRNSNRIPGTLKAPTQSLD